jgi:NADPH:quinone reductase
LCGAALTTFIDIPARWPRRRSPAPSLIDDDAGVKAALVRAVGALPEVGIAPEPVGDAIDVLAAPINSIDLAVSRGALAFGHPQLPYVPGCEAVGRTADGSIVWLFGGSLGRTSDGALAERAAIGDAYAVDVPEGADAALAAGLGIAGLAGWLPFAWRAPLSGGENVLVLGATGSVGLVAVQTARLLGAARVVAAGRSAAGTQRAAEHGADATLQLDDAGDLVTAFKEAFDGDGPSFIFDALWGEPAAAAVLASAPNASIVNLGQSAGATAALSSEAVRFKNLTIHGMSVYAVPSNVLTEQYRRLVDHALAGDIQLDVEHVPLDSVTDAWRRQVDGAGAKLVVVP